MEVFLDKQPEKHIRNLNEPMLVSILAEPEYAIETDLSGEEHALIEESVKRYHANPASFVPLKIPLFSFSGLTQSEKMENRL
jgi:hypothetical protein